MDGFDFGDALHMLREGYKVSRHGWNGKGMCIELQVPDANSKMQRPYIYIKTAQNELVPWCASHADLLGYDWFLYSE